MFSHKVSKFPVRLKVRDMVRVRDMVMVRDRVTVMVLTVL